MCGLIGRMLLGIGFHSYNHTDINGTFSSNNNGIEGRSLPQDPFGVFINLPIKRTLKRTGRQNSSLLMHKQTNKEFDITRV